MLSRLLALTLLLSVVHHAQAGLFMKDSPVKMLDQKQFKKALAQNRTAVVAFMAPWCGHCQKMTPEYEKAAKRLAPLVPLYAVDCDAEANKGLCASENIRGFPTVKLFKKGSRAPGTEYQGERTQAGIYNWAKAAVPMTVHKIKNIEGISDWSYKNRDKPRALLLNKSNKLPLLWVVLSNQFSPTVSFSTVRDRRGKLSKALGFPYKEDHNKPKVILYEPDKKEPVMYEGLLKYDALRDFFKKFSKGEADLGAMLKAVKEEKDSIPEMEMRKQEAEAIMQGKGYGNPHGGMPVGEDGVPHGANPHGDGHGSFNPHDPEFMKAHGQGVPHGHPPHGNFNPHDPEAMKAHGQEMPGGHPPHGHGDFNPHDPEYMKAHGQGVPHGHPHPHTSGEEAQKPLEERKVDEEDSSAVDDKELGDDGEESIDDGLGRDTADEL